MAIMIHTSENGKRIVFDDYQDNVKEYNSYWVEMCPHCLDKYKDILEDKYSDGAGGTCSVQGCENEADYYVDFALTEVNFVNGEVVETYKVVAYIEDSPYVFAICTDMKYAEKAKSLIIESGIENVEIEKMDYLLNTMEIDGKMVYLTE